MIGGTRIIGGDKDDFVRGYKKGLIDAKGMIGNYSGLEEAYRSAGLAAVKLLGNDAVSDAEKAERAAYASAMMDVWQEVHSYYVFLGEELRAGWERIVLEQIDDVMKNW